MPTTYNGIGTRYYGRKNEETRPGVCRQCGREVNLVSYDTRLWFVIVFVPVIPLGRKRIIEYCPACTRHFVMELDKWETAKQLEISGALEQYRSNPTPDAAIAAHQQLVHFHQSAQAADFRKLMREKFADNAKVQAYLGAALVHLGQPDEAATHFARAIQLRPDLPEARVGVAQNHIRAHRLDEARKLLDFLEKPGARQLYSLEPLEQLAVAYQQAGRHTEALELFARLQEALPAIADHTGFRKMVRKSEKASGRKDTLLPKRKFSWRRLLGADRVAGQAVPGPRLTWRSLAVVGILAGLFIIGMVIGNEYIRRHRTLYVVNAFTVAANVDIGGLGRVRAGRGVTPIVLPEGRHHASITGPVRQEVDFEMRSTYFSRWFSDPVWVLNPGNAAVLLFETVVYSRHLVPGSGSFHFGRSFFYFPEVTNPFRPTPASVQVEAGSQRTLTHLDIFGGPLTAVFYDFERKGQLDQALRFAEERLLLDPGDESLLRMYVTTAGRQRQRDRAEKFLGAHLTNRPVQIEWHRAYQNLRRDRQRDARLATEYDRMLQAEPNNSALMYLRGRLATNHVEGRRWFERASEADPRNGYPLYALGYDRAGVGDWNGARTLLARAVQLRPGDEGFDHALAAARFALGEFGALEQESRERLKREPLNYRVAVQLCDALIAQGRNSDVQRVVSDFMSATSSRFRDGAREVNNLLQRHVLYAVGDFAGLERHAAADRTATGRIAQFYGLIEQGRVAEALQALPADSPDFDEAFHLLTVSIAWRVAGRTKEAEDWYDRTLQALDRGDDDAARAAAVLRRNTEPAPAELDDVILATKAKAILLTALAQKHPARRADLNAAARRMNADRNYPYHLLQRATADGRGQ